MGCCWRSQTPQTPSLGTMENPAPGRLPQLNTHLQKNQDSHTQRF